MGFCDSVLVCHHQGGSLWLVRFSKLFEYHHLLAIWNYFRISLPEIQKAGKKKKEEKKRKE